MKVWRPAITKTGINRVARGRNLRVSSHAKERANARNIQPSAVEAALEFGRIQARPGNAVVYAIGRSEIEEARKGGVDISKHNGIQVVVSTAPGRQPEVITIYRNRNLQSMNSRRSFRRE